MNNIKKIVFLLIFFYWTFTFTFESLDLIQRPPVYLIPIIVILLYFNFLNKRIPILDNYTLKAFLCYVLIFTSAIIVPTLYYTFDYSYFSSVPILLMKLAIKNAFLLVLFLILYGKHASFNLYAKYYIFSCCLYVLCSLIFIAFPGLKEFWVSILHISQIDKQLISSNFYPSRIGVDGFAGFRQTFMMAIGVLLNIYIIISNNVKHRKVHYYLYVSLIILTLGTLLYGRIGSIVAFAGIGILIFYFMTRIRNILRGLSLIFWISLVSLSILIISNSNEQVSYWTDWTFDYIINFFDEGELTNSSTEDMFDMYFIPENKTIFIGDGYYTDSVSGKYYMSTDIGFLRNILFFGLPLTVVGYLTILFILIGLKKQFKKAKNKTGVTLSNLFILLLILFEIKGGIYFIMLPTILPFYYLSVYENRKAST